MDFSQAPNLEGTTQSRPHIRFILSRGAGKGAAHRLISEIRRYYPHATHTSVGATKAEVTQRATEREPVCDPEHLRESESSTVTISLTSGPDHVHRLALEWDEMWGDRGVVYIAGGDGSVNEVGAALARRKCAFGVIPMGTGNDFARGLYDGKVSRRDALALVERTRHAHFAPIDALWANEHICVNVFSLGYDTIVLREALRLHDRWPALGGLSYVGGVLRTSLQEKATPLRFSYYYCGAAGDLGQPQRVEQECTAMLVGNGQYYGSGYRPLPQAVLDDGAADLLYADAMSLAKFATLIGSYRRGTHLHNSKVHLARMRELRVERSDGEPLLWNVDGIIHESASVALRLEPAALTLARL